MLNKTVHTAFSLMVTMVTNSNYQPVIIIGNVVTIMYKVPFF